jgi:outer membrane protein TolC
MDDGALPAVRAAGRRLLRGTGLLLALGAAPLHASQEPPATTPPPAPPLPPPASPALDRPVRTITLDEAVQTAIQRNPSLQETVAAIRRAEAVAAEARSLLLPRFDGDARFTVQGPIPTFTITMPPATPGDPPQTQELALGKTFTRNFGVNGSYNIDLFGRFQDNRTAALRGINVARAASSTARNELAYAVQNVYLSGLRARELTVVAQEAVELAAEQLRVAEAQLRAGTAPEFDVLRASVQAARAW